MLISDFFFTELPLLISEKVGKVGKVASLTIYFLRDGISHYLWGGGV